VRETNQPQSGLEDQGGRLRKGLEDEEERKRREQLQKALTDQQQAPPSGLTDAPQKK
jgi:hypothetical protein